MTAPPENLADRPARDSPDAALSPDAAGPPNDARPRPRPHDVLSELLRRVRLSGEGLAAYAPPHAFSIGFADIGSLHVVEEGELALQIDGDPHVEHVSRGDVVLVPRGDPHHLSDTGSRTRAIVRLDAAESVVTESAVPDPTRWLSGTFTIGAPQASHLLGSLPPVIILRAGGSPALEGLEVARRLLVVEMESPSQGSAVMIARILDLIFIQILRAWAADTAAEPNWLAGALDPQIGPALSAVHRDPGHDWTVEELARACTMSRSTFAARFLARVGKPPATYLAHVRLDGATDLLRDTPLPLALVAQRVGYTSEAAFSRAFKNRYGTPPARWRQETRIR
jgi:AraC-like DNA-binding protein